MYLLWARQYAKFFTYAIPFRSPTQPSREGLLPSCYQWGNESQSLRSPSCWEQSCQQAVRPAGRQTHSPQRQDLYAEQQGLCYYVLNLGDTCWNFKEENPRSSVQNSTRGSPWPGRQGRMKDNLSVYSSCQQILVEGLLFAKRHHYWMWDSEWFSKRRKEFLESTFLAF